MPYSIKTKDGIVINNIPDDMPRDSQELKDRVSAIRAQRGGYDKAQPSSFLNPSVSQPPAERPELADAGWEASDYGFSVRDAVTPDTGKPTKQREDGAIWYGPEQGNTGTPGWFDANGQRASDAATPQTTAGGLLGAATRGAGPYAIAAGLGAAAGAPAGGVGAIPGAAAGAAAYGLADMVADPITSGINKLLGTNLGMPTEAVQELFTRLGVPEPQSEAERVTMAASKALGGAAGTIGLGRSLAQQGFGAVTQGVGRSLAAGPGQQMVASAAGGAASQTGAEMGADPLTQMILGVAGGTAGSKLAGLKAVPKLAPESWSQPAAMADDALAVKPAPVQPMTQPEMVAASRRATGGGLGSGSAIRALAGQAAPNPKTLEAARRLGIEGYLQPDHVTTNQAYREFTQAVKSIPGSATRSSEIEGLRQVGARADRLISELGGTTDLSRLNERVRTQLGDTVDKLSTLADAAYSGMREGIPAQSRGPASNVLGFVKQQAADLDGAENLSALERSILKRLSPVVDEAGNITKEPTYALIDSVRREVGAAAKAKGPFADADTGLAKHLYKLIDQDQEAIAGALGKGKDYEHAKKLVRMRKAMEDDMVAIYGKKLDQSIVGKLDTATKDLSKGDADKFAGLMKSIPQNMRKDVAASALNTAFGRATQNGELNFNTFSRWYEGLLANKQAHAALMSNLPPDARKRISDLYRVSRGVADATRERITTGRIQAIQQEFSEADSLLNNIYSTARRAVVGVPIEAATTAIGLPGAGLASGITAALTKNKTNAIKAADDLISSPEFLMLAKNPSAESASKLSASKPFRRYAKEAKINLEQGGGAGWVINAMRQVKNNHQDNEEPK